MSELAACIAAVEAAMRRGDQGEAFRLAAARRNPEGLNAYALALSACGRYPETLAAFEAGLAMVGQWQAYESELEPILPQLTPWRVRFGYQEASNAPQYP